MKNHFWRESRELRYSGSILDVYQDHMVWENGHTEEWDFVSHRKGAAAVVAVDGEGKLLMVRQYRNALERETLEIPAGARDYPTEDTALCAARELEEETGYRAGSLKKLLSLKSTVAFCDELIDIYLATELSAGTSKPDPGEEISLERYALTELLEKIFSYEIQDGKTVSGILAYDHYLRDIK